MAALRLTVTYPMRRKLSGTRRFSHSRILDVRRRWLRSLLYRVFTLGEVLSIIISASLSASLRADPKHLAGGWQIFSPPLAWIQDRAWLLLIAVGLFLAISTAMRKIVGPPWIWDAIHSHLDSFREYAFPDQPGDMLHEHRVTLFKRVQWHWCLRKWPWSGWLVPVERSGHTTRRTSAAFRAPDDANEAEGVAGATWASKSAVPVPELPDLSGQPSPEDVADYAKKTYVSKEWVEAYIKRGRPLAKSFLGIPVDVSGKRWGVIVLDSKREMRNSPGKLSLYTILAKFLSTLLERA
jgi:hypothetical protein